MSERQHKVDRPRVRRKRKQRALRLYIHEVWRKMRMPYLITCGKGHRLGRGSEPYKGTIYCKKCKKEYAGV